MNLRWFHALLIFLSAALAALFGVWCLALYRQEGGIVSLLGGVAAFAVALGLILYDRWFLRKTRALR
jgi:hypothetical protein